MRSISEYVLAQRRRDCKVCKLPPKIRAEVNAARNRTVPMGTIVEWLKNECRIVLTVEQFRAHYAAVHEGKAGTRAR